MRNFVRTYIIDQFRGKFVALQSALYSNYLSSEDICLSHLVVMAKGQRTVRKLLLREVFCNFENTFHLAYASDSQMAVFTSTPRGRLAVSGDVRHSRLSQRGERCHQHLVGGSQGVLMDGPRSGGLH